MQLIIKLNYEITSALFPPGKPRSSWLKCFSSAVGVYFPFALLPHGVFPCSASIARSLPRAAPGARV